MQVDDRIMALCIEALDAEGDELDRVLGELRAALHDHLLHTQNVLLFPQIKLAALHSSKIKQAS